MQGHEGLGKVIEVGKKVDRSIIGSYVATRGESAYADEYNVRDREYVRSLSAGEEYILELRSMWCQLYYAIMQQKLLDKFKNPKNSNSRIRFS